MKLIMGVVHYFFSRIPTFLLHKGLFSSDPITESLSRNRNMTKTNSKREHEHQNLKCQDFEDPNSYLKTGFA